MDKTRKILMGAAAILLPLFLSGCLNVKIVRGLDDPGRYFDRAMREIQEIQAADPGRKSRPHSLHILLYERDSRELVEVDTPMWLVKTGLNIGMRASGHDDDRKPWNRYDFDRKAIADLELFGRGLLVQVDDEDSQILIWLD